MAAFTRQELLTAAQAAEREGNTKMEAALHQMIKDLPQESPVYSGTLGKVARGIDDTVRVGTDSLSMGLADKAMGEQAQADTRASRERLPGYVELPADIAGGVMGMPLRIEGMLAGGLLGGGQGIVNAYGHQQGWIPTRDDLANMAYEGGKGAILGSGLAKVGEKIGNWWSGKTAQPRFPTDADLAQASTKATAEATAAGTTSARSADLAARQARLEAARAANATGDQNAFKNLQPANPAEAAATKKIVERGTGIGSKVQDAASGTARWLGKKATEGVGAAGLNLATHGWSGTIGTAVEGLGELIRRNPGIDPKQMEKLTSVIREGGDLSDPHIVDMARNAFAKALTAAERSPVTPNPRPDLSRLLFGGPR